VSRSPEKNLSEKDQPEKDQPEKDQPEKDQPGKDPSEKDRSEKDRSKRDLSKKRLGRFGAALRAARQREGLIQAEVAEAVGISRQYLSTIEQGEAEQLSLRVAWALCDALGLRAPVDLGVAPVEIENSDPAEPGVPPSLEAFAETEGLGPADIQVLAQITYRGRQPTEPWQWRVIHRVIAASLEERAE